MLSGTDRDAREELKGLVEDYHGFGMLTLFRVLIFRGWRSTLLAVLSLMLLFGQIAGPLGFLAFKLSLEDRDNCQGGAGVWAKFVFTSVALIYTARLSVSSLSHKLEVPEGFNAFNMPKWWKPYRLLDLVVLTLAYDTIIFVSNLFIVFQDPSVSNMIVNVLALEFFTMIDDEFKCAVLKCHSSFLDDMVGGGAQSAGPAAGDVDDLKRKTVLNVFHWLARMTGPVASTVMVFYAIPCLGSSDE